MKVIGVTGTNGKTTTACLIAGVLSHAGHKTGLIGTLGYFDGDDVEDPTHTTPPPEKLAALLARMVAQRLLPCGDGSFQPCAWINRASRAFPTMPLA